MDQANGKIKQSNCIKVYRINFLCHQNQIKIQTMTKPTHTHNGYVSLCKYKTISNFGRSTIVNTYIISKTLYLCTVLHPPRQTVTKISKEIRHFVFDTLFIVSNTQRSQTKQTMALASNTSQSKCERSGSNMWLNSQNPKEFSKTRYLMTLTLS